MRFCSRIILIFGHNVRNLRFYRSELKAKVVLQDFMPKVVGHFSSAWRLHQGIKTLRKSQVTGFILNSPALNGLHLPRKLFLFAA
jgi:hypothetical protein